MTRPTGTDAISLRHSPLGSCVSAEPSEYMPEGCRAAARPTKGIRSLVAGTCVPPVRFAVASIMVVVKDADRVRGRLGAAFHAQLGEQCRYVVLHGLLGQEHP